MEATKLQQREGRERLVEVALNSGHLRVLPVTFQNKFRERDIHNIMTIVRQEPFVKFSDRKEVAELVRKAYKRLQRNWPVLAETPLSTSLPRNLFSIGKDNLLHRTTSEPGLQWVGVGPGNQTWPFKRLLKSQLRRRGDRKYNMIFVSQDLLHVNKHYEAYNDRGSYFGIVDKDTMLLYAESITF